VRNATRDPRNQRGRNKREQGGNQAQGTEKRERRKGGKERQRKAPNRQAKRQALRAARWGSKREERKARPAQPEGTQTSKATTSARHGAASEKQGVGASV